ncbi:hypothetical protein V2S84_15710, partial [Azotobacter chroococcum]|nr:hypothetical protein [Azotobacter chroococcum]
LLRLRPRGLIARRSCPAAAGMPGGRFLLLFSRSPFAEARCGFPAAACRFLQKNGTLFLNACVDSINFWNKIP